MLIHQVSSFPIEQVTSLDALEERLGAWFAAREHPTRLLAYSARFRMEGAIARVLRNQAMIDQLSQAVRPLVRALDAALAGADVDPTAALQEVPAATMLVLLDLFRSTPLLQRTLSGQVGNNPLAEWDALRDALDDVLWRLPWCKEAIHFFERMAAYHLRSATYLLLSWTPPDLAAQTIGQTLRQVLARPVLELDHLPSPLACAYREHLTSLEPLQVGQPYYAVLHSYDMQDTWDATTLHDLLSATFDVAVAIDIQTLSRSSAQRTAEMALNAARLVLKDNKVVDTRAEQLRVDAHAVLHELRRQTLHDIQLAVLVGGSSPRELEAHVVDMRERLGPRLRLMRAEGAQGELIKLFGPTPRKAIDAPFKPRTQLSKAVGCMAGLIGFHRPAETDGIFIGIDARRRAALFMDLFKNNQAAHIAILGKTGFGKTVFINLLGERAAAVEGMQVIGIDAFGNGLRVEAALLGATCYRIGLEAMINILDVVFSAEEGDWLNNQVLHVVGQLSLLLGEPGQTPDGKKRYIPRVFSVRERGVLGRALQRLYLSRNVTPETPLGAMPILSDLLSELEAAQNPIADELAIDLRYLLYGSTVDSEPTPEGQAFNGPTTVDWTFQRDVVCYDFDSQRVPELWLPFYYLQAIGAVNRYIRHSRRNRARKIFLIIDEFGYASQVEAVTRLAVEITKTARKYGLGIVLVDQNPLTFLETQGGRQIYENAAARIMFHLDDIAARQVAEANSQLTAQDIADLPQLDKGECIAIIRNDVYRVNVEMNRLEAAHFMGS